VEKRGTHEESKQRCAGEREHDFVDGDVLWDRDPDRDVMVFDNRLDVRLYDHDRLRWAT
jgi:hypothetical protein